MEIPFTRFDATDPFAQAKLHKLAPDAVCNGVTTFCRRCKWEGVMNIKERKGA